MQVQFYVDNHVAQQVPAIQTEEQERIDS